MEFIRRRSCEKKPSMASAREFKEKRAEAAAKLTASDLEEINKEREYEE
jgi:hypothetical protein